jgi:hypothetical protein
MEWRKFFYGFSHFPVRKWKNPFKVFFAPVPSLYFGMYSAIYLCRIYVGVCSVFFVYRCVRNKGGTVFSTEELEPMATMGRFHVLHYLIFYGSICLPAWA